MALGRIGSLPDTRVPVTGFGGATIEAHHWRTIGFGANGAVSNLVPFPDGLARMRRELRAGRFDVVHVHEPPAPLISWDASTFRGAPVVGTFHAYATRPIPNHVASLLGALALTVRRVALRRHQR